MLSPNYYFDDPHVGPSRATSHPDFNAIAIADFYFDDRTSPFSSEGIGLSVLRVLEDRYREKGELGNSIEYIKNGLRTYYGQWGNPTWAWRYVEYGDDKKTLIASGIFEREGSQHAQVDFIIIAIAFGQYKIEGKIDPQLKELGLQAIRRRKIDFEHALDIKRKMNEEITPEHPWMKFLKQMQIMEEDLEKFAA
jgi:uncharacterized protein YfeS